MILNHDHFYIEATEFATFQILASGHALNTYQLHDQMTDDIHQPLPAQFSFQLERYVLQQVSLFE